MKNKLKYFLLALPSAIVFGLSIEISSKILWNISFNTDQQMYK